MEEIILKERETRENIVQTINKSNLPAFIASSITDLASSMLTITPFLRPADFLDAVPAI